LLSIERSDSSTTGTDGNKAVDYSNDNQINTVTTSTGTNEAYQFDTLGNRSTWSTDPLDSRRLLNDGTYKYRYDDEGNLSDKTEIATGKITSYQWDYRNRLVSVTSDSHTIEYLYDAQDKRVGKKLDGIVRERYIYDGDDIALVVDAQGTLVERYLDGDSTDSVLAVERDGTISWSLADRQGSIVDLVDEDGTVLNHFVYDSFGSRTQTSGVEFRYGYTGRELDGETGLYYYRARYYDPTVGRFISEDPMGFGAGDTNLYRYVFNNATNYTDPSGQIVPLIALAWAAGVVAGAAVTGAAVGATFGFARGAAESIDSDRRNGILSWESVGSAYIHGLIGAGKGAVVGAVGGAVVAGGGLIAGAIGVPTAVITGAGATLATVGVGAGVLSAGVNFANGNYATSLVDLAGALYGGSKLWSAYQNSRLRLYEEPNSPLLNSSGDRGGQIVPTTRSLAAATTPPGWSRGFDGALVASPARMLSPDHSIITSSNRMLPAPSTGTILGDVTLKNIRHVQIQGQNRIFLSKDPLVPDLVSAIEKHRPGIIKQVETEIYGTPSKASSGILTDVDIVTDKIIFQVKTGNAKGLLDQMIKTSRETQDREIVAIVTNKASKTIVSDVIKAGFRVVKVASKNPSIEEIMNLFK
jgi:RHS repeat-associated protein